MEKILLHFSEFLTKNEKTMCGDTGFNLALQRVKRTGEKYTYSPKNYPGCYLFEVPDKNVFLNKVETIKRNWYKQ